MSNSPRDFFNTAYPALEDLKRKAKKRVPKFAFEYLVGGCNSDVNLLRNKEDLKKVELMPSYLSPHEGISMEAQLFGKTYSAPFGIAPIGLQGLVWPKSPEILAKAAYRHNIPFILSTVTTASIEHIGEITNGDFWFQLYHPTEPTVTKSLLQRAEDVGCKVLVALADVPTFGYRPRDIRNGLAMPPKMSFSNMMQIVAKPNWALNTLRHGQPDFASLKPYMPKNLNLAKLGQFMDATFNGRLNEEKIKKLRDQWKGKMVLKGIVNERDAEMAIAAGVDGLIVSNHGGRQLDAGQSTIEPLKHLASKFKDKITIMMDSGIRSGPDIARSIASGAEFVFMGRPFMYGVGALGEQGGDHTIAMMKIQLEQVMEQLCCQSVLDLPNFLVKKI